MIFYGDNLTINIVHLRVETVLNISHNSDLIIALKNELWDNKISKNKAQLVPFMSKIFSPLTPEF